MSQSNMYFLYGAFVVILFPSVYCLEEGDSCTILRTGKQAKCKSILNCQGALALIRSQQFPQLCGYMGTAVIVCCSEVDENSGITPAPYIPNITRPVTRRKPTRTRHPMHVNPNKPNTTGYKSFQKCVEYADLVTTFSKPPILLIKKDRQEIDTCGFVVRPLVIGGVLAGRKEFPHMVLIGYESSDRFRWGCGGSLISERYVLTAGHCLINREHGNATVARMGVTEVTDSYRRQDIPIIDRIRYPEYDPSSYYNDIGLLKLEKPAQFNPYVRPACLYYNSNTINEKAVATGWGKTELVINSDKLLKVTLQLFDLNLCNDSFKKVPRLRLRNGILATTQVCAGSPGEDTCKGDSGGPLQIYSKIRCMYEIIGVTSFGKSCEGASGPGVYTRVSYFVDWIEKTVWG